MTQVSTIYIEKFLRYESANIDEVLDAIFLCSELDDEEIQELKTIKFIMEAEDLDRFISPNSEYSVCFHYTDQ